MPRACFLCISFRRESSWDPPPETTLQSTSWSSWATPRKAIDDDPPTVETPSSHVAAAAGTSATSVEMAVVSNEPDADVAPREGVSLGHGGVTGSGRIGGSSAVIVPSADEGGGGASGVAAAAGDEEAFFGDSADSSGPHASGRQYSTEIQVRGSRTGCIRLLLFLPRHESNTYFYTYVQSPPLDRLSLDSLAIISISCPADVQMRLPSPVHGSVGGHGGSGEGGMHQGALHDVP